MSDPSADGDALIGHNDVCLENIVFRQGVAVALLDFDFAAPTRVRRRSHLTGPSAATEGVVELVARLGQSGVHRIEQETTGCLGVGSHRFVVDGVADRIEDVLEPSPQSRQTVHHRVAEPGGATGFLLDVELQLEAQRLQLVAELVPGVLGVCHALSVRSAGVPAPVPNGHVQPEQVP